MRGWGAWIHRMGGGAHEGGEDQPRAGSAAPPARDGRRRDIEGLRGIAILLVVLYHSGLPLAGGYVGVDVFFVISGFLITGLLLRELERTGSIDLPSFYARRVRRLVPAAILALTATALWSAVVLSPLDQPTVMADGAAAAASVANLRFALDGLDYFSLDRMPSPFVHYWSLSVEEQFYLVWPGLLLAVALAARRLGAQRAGPAGGIALAIIATSGLAVSIALTQVAPAWGFYTLPARAWEFAVGGLIAVGTPVLQRLRRRIGSVIGCLAGALLLAGAAGLDSSVPYPGVAALLPTSAAAGLIVAGSRGGLDRALGIAPLQFLGRISYSLYLWHWPLIVLPTVAAGAALDLPTSLALLGLAVAIAWLSRRFVELPFLEVGSARPSLTRPSLALGAASLALVVAVSGGLAALAVDEVAHAGADSDPVAVVSTDGSHLPATTGEVALAVGAAALDADAADDAGPVVDASGAAVPSSPDRSDDVAASPSPAPSPTTSPTASPVRWRDIRSAPLRADVSLPAGVRPSLAAARSDEERLIGDGCFTWPDGTAPASCVYGNRHGKVTIALIGDSHASAWFPALNVLANRNGWRLLPFVKASCPFLDTPVFHPFADRRYTECETWRAQAIAMVNAARPDLVIVAEAFYPANVPVDPDDRSLNARGRAMASAIGRLRVRQVAIMIDNPRTDVDVPACLARYPHDINRCAIPRSMAFPPNFGVVERVAAAASGAKLVDIVAAVCPSTPCPVVRGGVILYRDGHHLTATFSRSLSAPLGAAVASLLPRSPETPAVPSPTPRASVPPPALSVLAAAPARPAASPSSTAPAPTTTVTRPPGPSGLLRDRSVTAKLDGPRGALEPVVATHPTDPNRLAVAYERRNADAGCGVTPISAGLAFTRDGGRTWRRAPHLPTDGTDRVPSYHSAVAWGPGPRAGVARLYWVGTTTRRCAGDLRVATAWSDDEGRTWSRLIVMRATPAWVGGDPDITVDRNPASPGFGTAWLTYNYPLGGTAGSGIRIAASGDFGRTWTSRAVARAPFPAGFPATWRFASRTRTAPDGTAYVSWYQADLRHWNPTRVFERGAAANVGSVGFGIAAVRCRAECASLAVGRPVMATQIARNAWTLGRAGLPGAGSHGYGDPMWSHGLDVDQATGTVYLAVAEVGRTGRGQPGSTVLVGRSLDHGLTWAWKRLPAATIRGAAQSEVRPGIVARDGIVVVGFRTVGRASRGAKRVMIGYGWSASRDGGRSFSAPVVPAGGRWPALNLDAQLNGPGTRDRIELTAAGELVFAMGDGRNASAAMRPVLGTVRLAVIRLDAAPATMVPSPVRRVPPWAD